MVYGRGISWMEAFQNHEVVKIPPDDWNEVDGFD